MTLPVYLVDDDDAVRKALILLLSTVGIKAKGFADPVVFLGQLSALEPGCLIFDIRMPAITGLKLQEKLTEEGIDWPVIIISGHGNIEACRRAFHNGAVDFLSKPVDEQDLIDAIQKAHRILARTLYANALQAENMALLSLLTAREREILERIALGFTTRQIADGLGLSPRTVDSHRAAIGLKLGTTSQAEMTRLWLEAGADR
ncbi:response regulator transcription factor [Agrobacterium tumefaciens]|uniref:Response regulator transcription factor n=1 Tax=Agrobacterium tumefaciens TaxID=358 RepID=A0AAP9E228_AGRTU|nr:response regulator transcription factor [Agrobacterium tumefaciens]NSZ57202.1 response regulator transcription factor [Agrobacterium tumefaciens]QDY93359.1 response regulator transcription factor [Agrobacterium tumefaciens]UXS48421.1 response regulator transcription factor [Agrobacterium tumefaciens]UXS69726.1 response regulator transcription factor [Agrobacterium tumefaciens]UXS77388.1 response regulator transcription factor [Agrobacterium tumefaciens]